MNKKNILAVITLALSVISVGFFWSERDSELPPISAREAVKEYLIDKNHQIRLEETSIARTIQLPKPVDAKGGMTDQGSAESDDLNAEEVPDNELANDLSGDLPDHNMAEYFRYLQTDLGEGSTPSERTESIREHLLATLPREKAGELIELYQKFTEFETDAISKADEWSMPESADETLALIEAMQKYQQEYFGEAAADLLFGAEMKVMEYNARRAIILNDSVAPGQEKEQLLDQLGTDMWGKEAYQAMSSHKDPYDILDEKLLIYRNELAAVDPATREEEISKLRATYLPPGY